MPHFTLVARINAGDGRFPFIPVKFANNHRPIPIEGATYYLRPSCGNRKPINVGKDVTAAHTALINMEAGKTLEGFAPKLDSTRPSLSSIPVLRKTIEEAAAEYIGRSEQKEHKTYLGYRHATNLFLASCKKKYFDEIRRDEMLDYKRFLQTLISTKTGKLLDHSTVFNYFLKTIVFLNDCGIGKYVKDEDWLQPKDWPVNVDKRNKNKKYAVYTEEEFSAMLKVSNILEEALIRFLVGTGFRIGEAAAT